MDIGTRALSTLAALGIPARETQDGCVAVTCLPETLHGAPGVPVTSPMMELHVETKVAPSTILIYAAASRRYARALRQDLPREAAAGPRGWLQNPRASTQRGIAWQVVHESLRASGAECCAWALRETLRYRTVMAVLESRA